MIPSTNFYKNTPFLVNGNEVIAHSSLVGEVCIEVPWYAQTEKLDKEQSEYIKDKVNRIMNYCICEGIFHGKNIKVSVNIKPQ